MATIGSHVKEIRIREREGAFRVITVAKFELAVFVLHCFPLLCELKHRGHNVVEESGRRIVDEERNGAGTALPWIDAIAFAKRAVAMSLDDRAIAAKMQGLVFFDRGLMDAAALEHAIGTPVL